MQISGKYPRENYGVCQANDKLQMNWAEELPLCYRISTISTPLGGV
jgi:hypothetical protein